MINHLTLLLALVVLTSSTECVSNNDLAKELADISRIDGSKLVDQYRDLNKLLQTAINSDEPEDNFNIVLEQYKKDLEKGLKSETKSMQAKRLFLALKTISEENRCSFASTQIIEHNDRAMERASRSRISSENGFKRVKTIFEKKATEHSRLCQREYNYRYEQFLSEMDPQQVSRVESFLKDVINRYTSDEMSINRTYNYKERLYHNIARVLYPQKALLDSSYIYESIAKLAITSNDPDLDQILPHKADKPGSSRFDWDKIKPKFEKYLVEPCEDYVRTFGPGVFGLADIDLNFYTEQTLSESENYYIGWLRYRLCDFFINQSDKIFNSLKNDLYNL